MSYPELQDSVETLNQLRRDRVAQELAELREHEIATQEHRLQRAVAEAEARAEAKGRADGETKGRADGIRSSVVELCRVRGIALDDDRQKRIAASTLVELGELLRTIASTGQWPE